MSLATGPGGFSVERGTTLLKALQRSINHPKYPDGCRLMPLDVKGCTAEYDVTLGWCGCLGIMTVAAANTMLASVNKADLAADSCYVIDPTDASINFLSADKSAFSLKTISAIVAAH